MANTQSCNHTIHSMETRNVAFRKTKSTSRTKKQNRFQVNYTNNQHYNYSSMNILSISNNIREKSSFFHIEPHRQSRWRIDHRNTTEVFTSNMFLFKPVVLERCEINATVNKAACKGEVPFYNETGRRPSFDACASSSPCTREAKLSSEAKSVELFQCEGAGVRNFRFSAKLERSRWLLARGTAIVGKFDKPLTPW